MSRKCIERKLVSFASSKFLLTQQFKVPQLHCTQKAHTSATRSGSSSRWLRRQQNDFYVKEAKRLGYRSRAAFKLLELNSKHKNFLANCKLIVDLGAAPGSWTQVALSMIRQGKIVAVDLLDINPFPKLPNKKVTLLKGDFTEPTTINQIKEEMKGQLADAILSDMAPNTSGIKAVDNARITNLCEQALEFAKECLKPRGIFVCKLFIGGEENHVRDLLRKNFFDVKLVKPKSSRSESTEVFFFASGFTASKHSTVEPEQIESQQNSIMEDYEMEEEGEDEEYEYEFVEDDEKSDQHTLQNNSKI